ncbi:hypothetical protein [uncultured Ruminococcus sp.]|uniref:hypothetical protein n=1 Tax=uncultured Ruminococcus sp. TaxID=165186 RepID=UPI0029302D28|nr:hypothetical protein [uncultured Ruminococcus sp.]
MENSLYTKNKVIRICSAVAVYLLALLYAIIAVGSIVQTSHIDPANPYSERITFDSDLIFTNLALIGLSVMAALTMMRKHIEISRLNTRFIVGVMLLFTTVLSLAWVNMVRSVPSGDSMTLLNTAKSASQGNFGNLVNSGASYGNHSYFDFYPNELGFVLFEQLFYTLFGSGTSALVFQIINVIALDAVYIGLVMIVKYAFDRPSVTNLSAILLTLFLQPMFITTYVYSYLIGLSFIVWAIFFALRFMKENKLLYAGLGILTAILGYILRPEYMVILIAVCIALVLHAVDRKKWLSIAMAALMVLCAFGAQKLVVAGYRSASGGKLNTHLSSTVKRYAGISESGMAPCWYNAVDFNTLLGSNMDMKAADESAKLGIKERTQSLSASRRTVEFFKEKLLSQINEPTFQSIWLSQVREHDLPTNEKLSPIVESVYTGGLKLLLDNWFHYFNMMVLLFSSAGMIWLILRKALCPQTLILPLSVTGGILYHMLYEAKSQYMLPYFIFLIPLAAYGMIESTKAIYFLLKKIKSKLNKETEKAPVETE